MTSRITEREYTSEMKQSFIDYAMTTITDRALPDVRDGLKPVHRRILYGMRALGITPEKPHKKSARIVGDVMGKYHPHGDSSVYMAMVRMAQDFSLMIPLVDGHGNFGSIDGDPAAAMRYTESRLAIASNLMLSDLEKEVVAFRPNYDDSEKEPVVLPARIPNLLINGSEGIATGMATNIPTHNAVEVADALLYCLKTKKPTLEGVMNYVSAPDYPLGGIIINEEEVKTFYKTGNSRVVMRGKYEIESGSYGKTNIVFNEIPRKSIGSKTKLVNSLIDLVNDKVLEEVTDVRDESSREGIRIVIEVRKGTEIDEFINKLWLKTNLQSPERMQMLVLVDGQPKTLNILEYFTEYISFQKEITINRHKYLLNKYKQRLEIVEGLILAHGQIDAIIDVIRGSKTTEDVKKCLMNGEVDNISFKLKTNKKVASKFNFTENQSLAILNMRLQKLIGLELEKLTQEKEQLEENIEKTDMIIQDERKLNQELIKDANRIKELYPSERKTLVTTKTTKKLVNKKTINNVKVVIDRFGYVKTVDDFDTEDSTVVYQADATSEDNVSVFTDKGNLYQIKMNKIPHSRKKDRGTPLQVLSGMSPDEVPVFTTISNAFTTHNFLFLSRQGNIKIVEGKEFVTNRKKVIGTGLANEDELISLRSFNDENELIVLTHKGRGLRIKTKDIPRAKRGTLGNRVAKLTEDDYFVESHFKSDDEVELNGKKIKLKEVPFGKFGITTKKIN